MDIYQLKFKYNQDNNKGMDQRVQGLKVDETIKNLLQEHQAGDLGIYNIPKSLGDLIKGDLVPVDLTQYEIEEEGVIEVAKAYPLDGYATAVMLLGFSSQSEIYQKWVSTLQNLGFERHPSPKEQRQQLEEQIQKAYQHMEAKSSG